MVKPILKRFRPPSSTVILVSSDSCADTQFQGNPFSGCCKYTGGGNWQFSTLLIAQEASYWVKRTDSLLSLVSRR